MNLLLKKILLVLLFFLITFCSVKKINKVHGIVSLELKSKTIIEGVQNKNDIIKNLGPPPLQEFTDKNTWIYLEVVETRNIYGSKKLLVNNTLILNFDNKGILLSKKILNINEMNDIAFDKDQTKSYGINNTVLKNILSSTRKRMENARKKN